MTGMLLDSGPLSPCGRDMSVGESGTRHRRGPSRGRGRTGSHPVGDWSCGDARRRHRSQPRGPPPAPLHLAAATVPTHAPAARSVRRRTSPSEQEQTSHGTRRPARRPHRLGHPRRRRRDPPRAATAQDLVITVASGASPSRPDPPGQPARVPDRRTSSPRRSAAAGSPSATCTAGTTTTGSARCRPASTRPGPSTSAGRCPPYPTRGAATSPGPSTSRRRCSAALAEMGVEMEEISQTEMYTLRRLPRADPASPSRAATRSRRCWRGTAPRRPRREARETEQEAAALADVGRRRRRRPAGRRRPGPVPLQALLPHVRPRHHHAHVVRRRDDRPRPTPAGLRLRRYHQPRHAERGQAGLEGRLADALGLRGRRLRARRHRPRDPRLVVHRRPGARRSDLRRPRAVVRRLRLRRLRRRAEDVVVARAACRPPADALQILEAPILRWLYVRRKPKQAFNIDFGPEVVRLYDEWDALGKKAADPEQRDAQVLAFERASSTSTAGRLPTPAVVVPFRLLSSVADVTAGQRRADQPDRRRRRPPARLGRRPRAAADQGDGLDRGVRARPRTGRRCGSRAGHRRGSPR